MHKIRLILFMFAERIRSCLSSAGKKMSKKIIANTKSCVIYLRTILYIADDFYKKKKTAKRF